MNFHGGLFWWRSKGTHIDGNNYYIAFFFGPYYFPPGSDVFEAEKLGVGGVICLHKVKKLLAHEFWFSVWSADLLLQYLALR